MLSSRDIRNIKNSLKKNRLGGGYDMMEVDQQLGMLAEKWETVTDDRRMAEEKVTELEDKLKHYEKVELALQEALETARDTARRTEEAADRKARLIIEEAELRAQRIIQEAEQERYGLRQDLSKLTNRQTEVAARLRGFLMSELEILARFQGDDPVGFIKLIAPDHPTEERTLESYGDPARLSTPEETPFDPTSDEIPPEAWDDQPLAPEASTPDVRPTEPVAAPSASGDEAVTSGESDVRGAAREATTPVSSPEPLETETGEERRPVIPKSPWPDAERTVVPPSLWRPVRPSADTDPAQPPEADGMSPMAVDPNADRTADASGWSSSTGFSTEEPSSEAPSSPGADASSGWSLRSLVTGDEVDPTSSDAERDKIRRILDDLD